MDRQVGVGAGVATVGAGALAYGTKQIVATRQAVKSMNALPLTADALARAGDDLHQLRGVVGDVGALARSMPKDLGSMLTNPLGLARFMGDAVTKLPPNRIAAGADSLGRVLDQVDTIAVAAAADGPKVSKAFSMGTRGGIAAGAGAALLTGGGALLGAALL